MKTALALILSLLSSTPAFAADLCPLDVVPGRSLGRVQLGRTLDDLAASGLPVTNRADHGDTGFAEVGPLHVRTCGGRVVEAWLDDVRTAPACLRLNGKPLARDLPKPAWPALFGKCRDLEPRIGGSFVACEDGGLHLGTGMGDFVQLRVTTKGFTLDDECADMLDDGAPAQLPTAELDALLQRVIDLDVLAPYWHPDRPGRLPLKVRPGEAVAHAPALSLGGAPIVYAPDGDFDFTQLESTRRRVRIEFRHAAEGVVGHVVFKRRGDQWLLQEKRVAEK